MIFGNFGLARPISNQTPILYKHQTSGFVPYTQSFTLTCEIYADHYKMVKKTPRKTFITMNHFHLPKVAYKKIAAASQGKMSYQVAPADIGNEIYGANMIEPLETIAVDLGSTRDGQHVSTNSDPAASLLKKFIDRTCQL